MATVTKIVDTDNAVGTNYTSMNSWESTEETDLETDTDSHICYCRATSGTADTTNVVIDGWTTTATYTLTIQAHADHQHSGELDTDLYQLSVTATSGIGIHINDDYTTVAGIQIIHAGTTDTTDNCVEINSYRTGVVVEKCIVKGGYYGFEIGADNDAKTQYIRNNIIYDAYSTGIRGRNTANGAGITVANNTVCYCNQGAQSATRGGIQTREADTTVSNNICYDNYNEDFEGTFGTGSNNFSKDTTAPGASSLTSQADPFVSFAGDNFHIAVGSNPVGAGTSLAGDFTDDIDGDTRSAWDMGADEYQAVGGGISIPVAMHHFMNM